jgi:phenylacetate-CoA ligase
LSKLTDRLYALSPVWLQQVGVSVYGWHRKNRRLGGSFPDRVREYRMRETWSVDRMREYVDEQLRSQVSRAYTEVPYYRERFRAAGIDESRIGRIGLADVRSLPFLEKAALRADPERILVSRSAPRLAPYATSGTTGAPITVYWDADTHRHNMAVREARSFQWAGVSLHDSRSVIGGRMVVPRAASRGPFWRYNRFEKQLYFSAFHISPANVADYVEALNRFRPTVMNGYASAHYFLARMILEQGLAVHSPKAIITESERLEPPMRLAVERAFGARAFEEYGSVENCGLASECERGRLHVHPDFGLVEILNPDGTDAAPGVVGEVVMTGFANRNQIFLRYRIGDLASWAPDPCPCGRTALPALADLVGRQEDTVVGPDGRETVRFHGLFVGIAGVAEGQVVQHAREDFELNVVPTAAYSEQDEEAMRSRLVARLGPTVRVRVRIVTEIPRGPNGKFRAVVSHVARTSALTPSPVSSHGHGDGS